MIRLEIVANHSVEENIMEAMKAEGVGKYYTKYAGVYGVGTAGPRMGDAIWPEENFALVIWCGEEEAYGIARAVTYVKDRFPDEGIKLFGISDIQSARAGSAERLPVRQAAEQAELHPEATQSLPVSAQAPPQNVQTLPGDGPDDPNAE
jgi:hypothetical protein